MSIEIALTIAGSDSGGGAGIQADLKTFTMHCVHGASVVCCVTAQNTLGVTAVGEIEPSLIAEQIRAIANDLNVNAVKTGMLLNSTIIQTVAEQIQQNWQLVVDPVMVSRAGAQLIDDSAIACMREKLIPQALIVTPNRYEAEILSGLKVTNLSELKQAAIAIYEKTGAIVFAKGGSLSGQERGIDVWYDGELKTLFHQAVATNNTHGTGCTLSAAICANLVLGKNLWQSVVDAKTYVTKALEHSLDIGAGSGPVGHFFPLLESNS